MVKLLAEYVDAVLRMDEINAAVFENRNNVKQGNRLADRVRKIAFEIEKKYPELKPDFYQLLFHKNASVRGWVAHHVLEVMSYDDSCRSDALNEIVNISNNDDSIHSLGNRMWLEQWFEKHPEDKELL
jgi:hypothetical protein